MSWQISSLSKKLQEIANKIDSSGEDGCVKDGWIQGKEVSLFTKAVNEEYRNGNLSKIEYNSIFRNHVSKSTFDASEDLICRNDAIPDLQNQIKIIAIEKKPITCTETAQEPTTPDKIGANSEIVNKDEWSEEAFNKVLEEMLDAPKYNGKFRNSVLRGQAKAFIEAGEKYNIDPRLIVAVAMQESKRGISRVALKYNNVGGLMDGNDYIKFSTPAESIDSIGKTLQSRYNEGHTTPAKVAKSGGYCAKSASAEWLRNVISYLNTFNKHYAIQ
jgi:hypothetical protein